MSCGTSLRDLGGKDWQFRSVALWNGKQETASILYVRWLLIP